MVECPVKAFSPMISQESFEDLADLERQVPKPVFVENIFVTC
jgi:hypothetical protein